MTKYKVTPSLLRVESVKKEFRYLCEKDYIFGKPTFWFFKWAANLHVKYLLWSGYDCVSIGLEQFKELKEQSK